MVGGLTMTILHNCRLISILTEGYHGEFADVVLEHGLIDGIYPAGTAPEPEGAETLDIKGMTLLPGLFDLHAHLMVVNQDWNYLMLRPQNQYLLDCVRYAKEYLRLGFTTIRDCGNDYYASVAVRDYIADGTITGSRVITSGKILSPTTKGNSSFGTLYKEVDSPSEMMKVCREEMANGVDFIKYMCTGAVLNLGGEPGAMVTTPEELSAIVRAADSLGTYIAAHCHGTCGINEAVKAGVYTIEHASYMTEESAELMIKHKTGGIVPTFSMPYTLVKDYAGNTTQEFIDKSRDAIVHMAASAKLGAEAGVRVGFGTDLDLKNMLEHIGIEFLARAEFGIEPLEILREATIESAAIVGMDDVCGTIKAGKLADLCIFEGKPDEDISVMSKYPLYVFKDGQIFRN